jgi:membrane-bound ClpP family serine protease
MNGYGYRCNCGRCRSRGIMGPAVLVTLGILMLLSEFGTIRFHYTWPVLLIVIGLVKVYQTTTSTEGHLQGYGAMTPPTNVAPPTDPGSGQVHNG